MPPWACILLPLKNETFGVPDRLVEVMHGHHLGDLVLQDYLADRCDAMDLVHDIVVARRLVEQDTLGS